MARSPLTRELNPEERSELAQSLAAFAWAEGDPVALAGEELSGSYLLASGRARVTRDTADGKEITLDIAAPGDVLGPVHTHPAQSTESAWAMETTCALYLPADRLAELVENYPTMALAIMRMQQDNLTRSRTREVSQATRTVIQRVAEVLVGLDRKLGQPQADGSHLLQVRLRQLDIAGMAGTTVESVSRVTTKLKASGIVTAGREWVAINDPAALTGLAASE